jgi:hypothetical protein
MPVPTYPSTISLNNIQTEFGGANPIAISEYYSGGTYVGSGTANSTGTTIPTSGQISFLNFSGAVAAPPAIGWWYARILPNTAHYSSDTYTYVTGMRSSANANNIVMTRGVGYQFRMNTSSGTTSWLYESLMGPNNLSIANNDSTVLLYFYNRYSIEKVNPAGVSQWVTNTTNTLYSTLATNDHVWVLGRGASNNGWLARLSTSDGSTVGFKWGFGGGTTYIFGSYRSMMTTENEDRIFVIARHATNGCRLNSFWAANGTYRWGVQSSRTVGHLINDGTDRCDSSGNWYARCTQLGNEFVKITDGASAPTYGYTKALPVGNTINYLTSDSGGNVYVAALEAATRNSIVTKVDSGGTAQWSRRFKTLRTGNSECLVKSIHATPTELVFVVLINELLFDSKHNNWYTGSQLESYILRVPPDGANTGTMLNLSYESATTQTLTTPGGSWSTNTAANLDYAFASFTSNTKTQTSNTSKYITGTAR